MNPDAFEDKVLLEKKARFLAAVTKTAKYLGVDPPPVEFNEDRCPYEGSDEWAHIHLDTGLICVSKKRLKQMSFEKIEETASHEVTHLVDPTHDPSFYVTHDNAQLGTWKPPGGVYVSNGNYSSEKPQGKAKKSKIDKTICNFHSCKEKEELHRCKYCYLYFCKKHMIPKQPRMYNLNRLQPSDILDLHNDEGHPCADYAEYSMKEEEKRKKREQEGLKRLLGKSSKYRGYYDKELIVDQEELDKLEEQERKLKNERNEGIEKIETFVKTPVAVVKKCYYCNTDLKKYSYECNYCKHHFCNKHKESFNHNCEILHPPPTERINVKPVQDTEAKKEENLKERKPKKRWIIFSVVIILAVILIALFLIKITVSKENTLNQTKIIFVSKNITQIVPIEISFEDYVNNLDSYANRVVIIEGALYNPVEGSDTSGVYVYYIRDDYGRKIKLLNLSSEQKALFVKRSITKEVYSIAGVLKKKVDGLELTVSKIILTQRITREVTKQVSVEENVTEPITKTSFVKISLFEFIKEQVK